jgi:hypothetical protein
MMEVAGESKRIPSSTRGSVPLIS